MKVISLLPILVFFSISLISCKTKEENTEVKLLSVAEAKIILAEEPDAFFMDVRTPEEYREGHIEGAVLVNFFDNDFKEQVDTLDREKPVYIYCRSGNRSRKAGNILMEMGFKEVYDIDTGYMGW